MLRNSHATPAREYAPGIGDAVANRTINRKIDRIFPIPETRKFTIPRRDDMSLDHEVNEWCLSNGILHDGYDVISGDGDDVTIELIVVGKKDVEKWEDVAYRVALGNASLNPTDTTEEFHEMHHHLRQASILMSGRHLQHGDETQPQRNMEVFTNCSTAAVSFLSFYLLLNGSGVGRSYDNAMMKVDWSNMPTVVPVIDQMHPDCQSGEVVALDRRNAEHLYAESQVHVFDVPDSREGWTKAIEKMELMAYQENYQNDVLILDFSKVRERGAPIKGMQDRPASGPGPLMSAITNINRVRKVKSKWRQNMYVDHYMAECVLVGGARRAARMATKTWRDKNVLEFINVKRGGFLWSSNNSVTVDREFWDLVACDTAPEGKESLWKHANKVLEGITYAAYHDGTGEPGIINQDKLAANDMGLEDYLDGLFAESIRYKLESETLTLTQALAQAALDSQYIMVTNPCGEITISMLGAYCVIADTVPYHSQDADDAEGAFRTATRALMRTNLMDSLYSREVKRTNRIGVGITGLHEYAWKFFGYGFRDIIDEERSKDFWLTLARFKRAVSDEAEKYAKILGVTVPHTNTTIKPAGTTSKLFALSEGAHLPSMREYLRWVQFRNDDPLIEEYRAKGYPVKKLTSYSGTTIVGFPTRPEICNMGMGDKLVTAAEATPEEQYQYLRLLEKYWIRGVEKDGVTPLKETGNQVSYTLKYNPEIVSYEEFKRTLTEGQSTIRCCSVMPQEDTSAYEYQPEEPVTKHEYELILNAIKDEEMKQDIGKEHVDCANGACPVDFGTNSASEENVA